MSLRILMFGWEFPPHNSGGLGTACEGLTRALTDKAVEVIFVLPKFLGAGGSFLRIVSADIDKITFRPVNSLLSPYLTSESYERLRQADPGDLYGRSLLEEVRLYATRARKIATAEQFDVIHAHDWLAFPAGLAAKAVSGKPLVVHVHATEFDRSGGHNVNQEVYEIERAGMSGADKIIAVSQWTKDIIVRHYGVSADKVQVVHNGVDLTKHNGASDRSLEKLKALGDKIVLFVGRLTLQKGPDYFVRVAKKVLEFYPRVFFVMVGSGDMMGQILDLAARLSISDRIIFPGFLRGSELNAIYQAADLYVLPSVSEPFGITPLEAMASGTPVIISKQSGVAEVVSHGLKADFWDIDEMANQILAVLKHSSLKTTLVQNAEDEVKKINWPAAADKCLSLYQQLVPA